MGDASFARTLSEFDNTSARTRLEQLAIEIGAINDKKRGWQEAWEIEMKRTNDPELEKPLELRAFNKQLGPLYSEKEDILRRFPHLEAEYGGKKRKQGASPLSASRSWDKAARKAKKKSNHETNLARRREEDRARARGGTGSGSKKGR